MMMRRFTMGMVCIGFACAVDPEPQQTDHAAISTGAPSSRHAVVFVASGCTGTLIRPDVVLTAAHCFCHPTSGCRTREAVTFRNAPRFDRTIAEQTGIWGTVQLHPDYRFQDDAEGADLALLILDEPPSAHGLDIAPLRVAGRGERVRRGDSVTFSGYGHTGANCQNRNGLIRFESTQNVDGFDDFTGDLEGYVLSDSQERLCGWDSGAPLINAANHVVGVAVRATSEDSRFIGTRDALTWLTATMCRPMRPEYPDASFCNDPHCPCASGEGDCDVDRHCEGSATCVDDIGTEHGLPWYFDVCVQCPRFDPNQPDARFCELPYCPCGLGEGDCDPGQCKPGLVCGVNNGAAFGLNPLWEVCVRPGPTCGNGQPDSGEACDDGNTNNGDGCDRHCRVESGWTCPAWDLCYEDVPRCFPHCFGDLGL